MTTTSYRRGRAIRWDGADWRYADTGELAATERPCPTCDKVAEPGGPDPCLGILPDVTAACCGHGVEVGYAFAR